MLGILLQMITQCKFDNHPPRNYSLSTLPSLLRALLSHPNNIHADVSGSSRLTNAPKLRLPTDLGTCADKLVLQGIEQDG